MFEYISIVESDVILDCAGNIELEKQLAIIQLTKRDLAIAKIIQPFVKIIVGEGGGC